MRKFRINNDIPVIWRIVDRQNLLPFDLEGKTVQVVIQNRFSVIPIRDFSIEGNTIAFIFRAAQQSNLGVYTITATITDDANQTWTADGCDIFELVPRSCCADVCETHAVDATSCVEFAQFLVVDQEVNADSPNPVSGAAVAKALEAIDPENMIRTTYRELVDLRNGGKLTSGKWYRITDYAASVNGDVKIENRQAFVPEGHGFDILVLATSTNTLSEEARALQNDEDVYFDEQDLEAWRVWYSLDNNRDRFDWAETQEGKGVIYRLIDQNNNDLPFDFKGISILAPCRLGYFYDNIEVEDWEYAYAFNYSNVDGTLTDVSLHRAVRNCRIAPKADSEGCRTIPKIVFGDGEYATGQYPSVEGVTIGANCDKIYCWGRTRRLEIGGNTIAIFMEFAEGVKIGSYCSNLNLGVGGNEAPHRSIIIGDGCDSISIPDEVENVSIGEGCLLINCPLPIRNAEFGNGCDSIKFNRGSSAEISTLVVDPGVKELEMTLFEPNLRILKGASGLTTGGPIAGVNSRRMLNVTSDGAGKAIGWYDGDATKFISVTYSDLQTMAAGKLMAGSVYCLTDYVTEFNVGYAYSSNEWHIDIFLTAISAGQFDENAFAVATHSESGRVKHLRLKYARLDNTGRFPWANDSKGVIYYMEDEQGNYAPFDFLNYRARVRPVFQTNYGPVVRNENLDQLSASKKYAYSFVGKQSNGYQTLYTEKSDPAEITPGTPLYTQDGNGLGVVRMVVSAESRDTSAMLYDQGNVVKIQPSEKYYSLPYLLNVGSFDIVVSGSLLASLMETTIRVEGEAEFLNCRGSGLKASVSAGRILFNKAVVENSEGVNFSVVNSALPTYIVGVDSIKAYDTVEYTNAAYRFLQTPSMDAPIVQNLETFENEGVLG